MYFGIFCVLCTINCYFEYRIWILCLLLYMGTYLKDFVRHFSTFFGFPVPEVLTIFVRNIFLIIWGIWGVLMPPPPSPASLSKIPSGGKNIEHFVLINVFYDFYFKKLKNCTKQCSVLKRAHIKI